MKETHQVHHWGRENARELRESAGAFEATATTPVRPTCDRLLAWLVAGPCSSLAGLNQTGRLVRRDWS